VPETSGATSIMPDTVLRLIYCETCCQYSKFADKLAPSEA
jgi:hypothetical protein